MKITNTVSTTTVFGWGVYKIMRNTVVMYYGKICCKFSCQIVNTRFVTGQTGANIET